MSVERNSGSRSSVMIRRSQSGSSKLHGQKVYAEDFASKSERWISGVIQEVTGPVSYKIRLEAG